MKKSLKSWDLGYNHDNESVCLCYKNALYTQSSIAQHNHQRSHNNFVRNRKTQIFEKISKYCLRLGHWPASESWKSIIWARTWEHATGLTRDQVTRIGQHCFWKFWHFCKKKKAFQKQLKHSKIFLCLINKNWACENTFNLVQSRKWIWHSLNINMCDVCGYQQWDSP